MRDEIRELMADLAAAEDRATLAAVQAARAHDAAARAAEDLERVRRRVVEAALRGTPKAAEAGK